MRSASHRFLACLVLGLAGFAGVSHVRATSMRELSIEELTAEADAIVHATVVRVGERTLPSGRRLLPFRITTLRVHAWLKGAASLDDAMWFHRPSALDGWLLYAQDSPSSSGSRGFSRGLLYTREGTLIASVAQEGLVRLKRQPNN